MYLITISLFILLAYYICIIIFCSTLQSIVENIELHNRFLRSEMVWLNVIPIFNIFWSYRVNGKICKSIKKQLIAIENSETGDYGLLLGQAYPLLFLGSIIIWIPGIQFLLILSSIICLSMFWTKMRAFEIILKNSKVQTTYSRSAINDNPDLLD